MIRKAEPLAAIILVAVAGCNLSWARTATMTTLVIDVQNFVEYQQDDISNPSKLATNPKLTPTTGGPINFANATLLGDIVAVNGQPAKGTYVGRTRGIVASPAPRAGGAITDVTRTAMREHYFEIQQADGTAVGTIMSLGFSGGPPPPGAPATDRGNEAIVGGTGAFLGARGLVGGTGGAGRAASMTEDPGNRRINGGAPNSLIIRLIPMSLPQAIQTPTGPAITHSRDFTLVSASKPAAAGEVLSLFATGLGPTVPSVETWTSFSFEPLGDGQFADNGDGEWKLRRRAWSSRVSRLGRWLPNQLSSASGCGQRRRLGPGQRSVDCRSASQHQHPIDRVAILAGCGGPALIPAPARSLHDTERNFSGCSRRYASRRRAADGSIRRRQGDLARTVVQTQDMHDARPRRFGWDGCGFSRNRGSL